jgi:NAD-dependent deacetylase
MSVALTDRFLTSLLTAQSVVAFTGAGVSAESGVPTFRGTDGLWAKFRPEELANVDAFIRNPSLVWEWYAHRKRIIASIEPNAGHRALVEMEALVPSFTIITQNIDNLHTRAGSSRVVELHGNIERNYCIRCGCAYSNASVLQQDTVPTCAACGGLVRPDVVWFGEMLPEDQWDHAVRASESADVFLSIGTSGVVYPAASLPLLAKRHGAFLVEVNPDPTPLTGEVDEFLRGPSGVILPAICDRVRACKGGISSSPSTAGKHDL